MSLLLQRRLTKGAQEAAAQRVLPLPMDPSTVAMQLPLQKPCHHSVTALLPKRSRQRHKRAHYYSLLSPSHKQRHLLRKTCQFLRCGRLTTWLPCALPHAC